MNKKKLVNNITGVSTLKTARLNILKQGSVEK